ncbi:MAG: hypothetical protein AN484_05865 [Aphanizomenon flos-aquae WA102]|uniref:Uncharacterized protein n=1 Tax=Aphanizomenon flos-aquae WA102 TaxID=1710896 RepID=A0A1B7X5N6_APHFL|nr:MAG: hypothetical protein AN484_05865 [Aphanizomenon flos-aquae WA102]
MVYFYPHILFLQITKLIWWIIPSTIGIENYRSAGGVNYSDPFVAKRNYNRLCYYWPAMKQINYSQGILSKFIRKPNWN